MISNTLTNIYIFNSDGSLFGKRVSELCKQFKTYPILAKSVSLSSSEDFDHPLRNLQIDHIKYNRFIIHLSTNYPCPEFQDLLDLVKRRRLEWAIIAISVYTDSKLIWRGDFTYFCQYVFPYMWKNYCSPDLRSLECGNSKQTNSNVSIEDLNEENKFVSIQ